MLNMLIFCTFMASAMVVPLLMLMVEFLKMYCTR